MVILLSSTEHSSLCGMRKFTNKCTRKYLVTDQCSWSWSSSPKTQRSCFKDSCSLQDRAEYKIVKSLKSVSSVSKQMWDKNGVSCLAVTGVDSKHLNSVEVYSPNYGIMEEPWLLQHSQLSHRLGDSDLSDVLAESVDGDIPESNILSQSTKEDTYLECELTFNASHKSRYSISLEEDIQVEEPWLVQLLAHSRSSEANVACDAPRNDKSLIDRGTQGSEAQNQKIHGKLLAVGETSIASQEDLISTVILINSSVCTMQRIAVLENGKLVELFLEPVKNNVQCNNVYLGVVSKLVPHMGGAFVTIVGARPSLMDIKPNREPFVFPSNWYQAKEKDVSGSLCGNFADTPGTLGNSAVSDVMEKTADIKDDEIEDGSEEFMDDEFGDHDDNDSWEDLKRNCNSGVARDGFAVEDGRYSDTASQTGYQPQDPDVDHQFNDDKVVGSVVSEWGRVKKGTRIVVQVVKEELGTKSPTLTAYPELRSRFWILISRCSTIGISKKISGVERTRLRVIAKTLQPPGFGLTVRTVAAGHSLDELQKDLEGLLSTWKSIMELAKSAALAADEGVGGAVPAMLHQATGRTLSVVQDYFSEKVDSMIVDSPRTYHEVTSYLQDIAPSLCDAVELYTKTSPLFDEYKIEEEIDNVLSKRVPLANGGYLVIEQTEALVSIDVNGGHCMLRKDTSKEKAILDVNLTAAKQIARELRLRDVGGIIVVDFIDMQDDSDKRLVYEEVKKAVERDRSRVKISELSKYGLMEITRKRVRPSVTFMITEQCNCCSGIGRVEALETSFSKVEHEICRLLSMMNQKPNPEDPRSWPSFVLRVDQYMCNYLTSGRRTKLAVLSSSLKVWILLKVDRGFSRGSFDLKPVRDEKESKQQHKSAIPISQTKEVGTYDSPKMVTLFPFRKWRTGDK